MDASLTDSNQEQLQGAQDPPPALFAHRDAPPRAGASQRKVAMSPV
jgi:hypothetical protein